MVWEVSPENVALAIERWKKLSEKYKEAPKNIQRHFLHRFLLVEISKDLRL